jgi:hypothetical protein
MAYERIKIPARQKKGNAKSILISIDKIFSNTKNSVKKNIDKMTDEHKS